MSLGSCAPQNKSQAFCPPLPRTQRRAVKQRQNNCSASPSTGNSKRGTHESQLSKQVESRAGIVRNVATHWRKFFDWIVLLSLRGDPLCVGACGLWLCSTATCFLAHYLERPHLVARAGEGLWAGPSMGIIKPWSSLSLGRTLRTLRVIFSRVIWIQRIDSWFLCQCNSLKDLVGFWYSICLQSMQ